MTALYEISDQFKALEMLDDVDQETLNDTLESLTDEFESKSVSVAAYFLNMDSDIAELKAAEKRIADRRRAIENKSASLKEYLLTNMQRLEISEISCPEFKVKVTKPRKIVEVDDLEALSEQYINTKVVKAADKKLIAADIKAGSVIDGARLVDGKVKLKIS